MRRIVGVDPGLAGAMTMIDGESEALLGVYDAAAADGKLMAGDMADMLADWMPELVVVEGVHSMPGQGVRSMFTFGRALGTVEGIVAALGIPSDSIPAHVWKAKVGVTKDKRSALALAGRLWPQHRDEFKLVKHHGRAEAGLLAVAYMRRLRGSSSGGYDDVQQSAACHHNGGRVTRPCR